MYELKDKKNLIFIFLLITEIETKNRKKKQIVLKKDKIRKKNKNYF